MTEHPAQKTERLQVSAEVVRLLSPETPHSVKLKAARGGLQLSIIDQVHAQLLLYSQGNAELKNAAMEALKNSSNNALKPVLEDPHQHPKVLDFLAKVRMHDLGTLILIRTNPAVENSTWKYVFRHCNYEVLDYFCDDKFVRNFPRDVCEAILDNNQASKQMKELLAVPAQKVEDKADEDLDDSDSEESVEEEDYSDDFEETRNVTKQQMVLELDISEKIKYAMTGDKEWRTILIKDSNKLVSGAVLKNPRITEGEVLFQAQNRSASEEIIRLILLEREWMKNYGIRHALVIHPRTPVSTAMRLLNTLHEKDIQKLAKSRNVSSAITNACRRMLATKKR
ncbi:hypothetical protein [Desulfuromonas acetoxidans]|uniref:Uncharacterized protein n=1 Tax=Desulfuromonas acetoxidans (strain DSM 684 / 11070) TaxID=281689 RepID=Q1JXI1_DESA6|nr:hypothetical protein [Desulfuromonas acetoxidans]EAT14981.1 conserved hypothetical protein [Desulfuromonas acetoxidans DSM 684]MBF0646114.1 hypothetical protein [Desulfuromonas acetoxidans]NVD25924.1 hypothetical protein [Desulfuromonas acetoxidans]NVE17873.1 hypothetical protein [Desulfuromonas acetoxidans]